MPLDERHAVLDCARCTEQRACRSCQQRRRRAHQLVEIQGLPATEAAQQLKLPTRAVLALVAQERDRLELRRFKLDSIPIERARSFLERELARDLDLSRAEIARRMRMQQADFDRQFGYAPGRSGRTQQRVGIPAASRLAIALGRAPNDLEGC